MRELGLPNDFGGIKQGNNPATTCYLLPACVPETQTSVLNSTSNANTLCCNNCSYLIKSPRPNGNGINARCTKESNRPGGSFRVIKLGAREDELLEKPFWCPKIKEAMEKDNNTADIIKIGQLSLFPRAKKEEATISFLDRKRMWKDISGFMSWNEIEAGKKYHLPPTLTKHRRDILVKNKYMTSLQAVDLSTEAYVWIYKDDEEHKFLKPLD